VRSTPGVATVPPVGPAEVVTARSAPCSGAHADELCLPVANLHRVPDTVPDEAAVFIEPLAAAWRAFEQVDVTGRRVSVLGIGKLGQLVARCARIAGGDVTGIGRSASSRATLERAGLTAIAPDEVGSTRFDVVVDATGAATGIARALELTRPLGDVILKTTTHGASSLALAPLVIDEVRITGSRCGRFEPAIELLTRSAVDPTTLVSAIRPLGAAVAAYQDAGRSGAMKILLRP